MIVRAFSLTLLGVGIFVLMQVLMPYLAFKAWEFQNLGAQAILVNPFPQNSVGGPKVLGVSVDESNSFPSFIGKGTRSKYPYFEFKLTVPKMGLGDIKVKVNSNDFQKNLAQLPGTALPGEKGNVFISGHSSLSQKVEEEGRIPYFIDLPKLRVGDSIELATVGQKFKYTVVGIKIVDPKDVSVINPPDNQGRYLTLMTCVPPGFNTKRLIVLAKLK